jgi:drug/metabolite transporter (DMT)-like permease
MISLTLFAVYCFSSGAAFFCVAAFLAVYMPPRWHTDGLLFLCIVGVLSSAYYLAVTLLELHKIRVAQVLFNLV